MENTPSRISTTIYLEDKKFIIHHTGNEELCFDKNERRFFIGLKERRKDYGKGKKPTSEYGRQ
jgi:hypothetical protein